MKEDTVIRREDPQAIEKLQEKLKKCEETQAYMKAVNAYYRKNGTCHGYPGMSEQLAEEYDQSVKVNGYSWERSPFSSYELSGMSAEIRRIKERIKDISESRETGYVGWEFEGGRVEANAEKCRLQIFFDERPDADLCRELKQRGFHWSPTEGAWQRQLNRNAIWTADWISRIKPKEGCRPSELQPKAKKEREGDAR